MENHCFICQKKCRALVQDTCVEKELEKIRQLRLDHQPHVIYFRKDGTFRWGEIQSMVNDEEDSESDYEQENVDPELNRFDGFGGMDEEWWIKYNFDKIMYIHMNKIKKVRRKIGLNKPLHSILVSYPCLMSCLETPL